MPYNKIIIQPGLNTQATQTLNEGQWSACNLIKFRNGLMEKISGWAKLFSQACGGIVRALHAYADLYDTDTLLIGGDGGPQIYVNGVLSSLPEYKAIGTGVLFSASKGSALVTVTNVPFPVTAGEVIQFPQQVSVGGYFYAGGSTVQVTTAGTGTFTFNLPTLATVTTTNVNGVPFISWGKYSNDETSVEVNFGSPSSYSSGKGFFSPGYGPLATFALGAIGVLRLIPGTSVVTVGQTFTFDLETSLIVNAGQSIFDLSIPAGVPYTVIAVVDDNDFVITVPAFAGFPRLSYSYLAGSIYNGVQSQGGPQIALTAESTNFSYYTTGNSFFIPGHSALAHSPLGAGGSQNLVTVNFPVSALVPGTGWSVDNFGEYGLYCAAGGPIYQYTPPLSSSPGLVNLGASAPQINEGIFVAMPQAQVIAFGSEKTIGGGAQDPLLVRWSDVADQYNFISTVTNEAGDFRLSRGSKCVGGIQAPTTALIWSDVDLWSMAYVGVGDNDSIYAFTILASGCGLIGMNARCVLGATTFWMGQQTFWIFNANGAQPVECPVWDVIWNNINLKYANKIVAAADSNTQEVWFFYPSMASTGENDSYVKYQTLENLWDYGMLARTAWIDQSVFGNPLAADTSAFIQQHEVGSEADGGPITGAFAETGFFDISDGTYMMFLDLIIPDLKWIGNAGYVNITLWAVKTPGDTPVMYGPFPVTPTTGIISTGGVRARSIALRIDWGLAADFNARLGAIRCRIAPAGRV